MAASAAANTSNDMVKSVQDQVTKFSAGFTKSADEVTKANKDVFDAVVKSSEVTLKGVEESAKRIQNYATTSLENGMTVAKDIVNCRNVNELIDLQTGYAKKAYDSAVVEASALAELGAKVANDAFAPIQQTFTSVVEKVTPAKK